MSFLRTVRISRGRRCRWFHPPRRATLAATAAGAEALLGTSSASQTRRRTGALRKMRLVIERFPSRQIVNGGPMDWAVCGAQFCRCPGQPRVGPRFELVVVRVAVQAAGLALQGCSHRHKSPQELPAQLATSPISTVFSHRRRGTRAYRLSILTGVRQRTAVHCDGVLARRPGSRGRCGATAGQHAPHAVICHFGRRRDVQPLNQATQQTATLFATRSASRLSLPDAARVTPRSTMPRHFVLGKWRAMIHHFFQLSTVPLRLHSVVSTGSFGARSRGRKCWR